MDLLIWCANKKCEIAVEVPEREYHHVKDGLPHSLDKTEFCLVKWNLCPDCHSESFNYLYPLD